MHEFDLNWNFAPRSFTSFFHTIFYLLWTEARWDISWDYKCPSKVWVCVKTNW